MKNKKKIYRWAVCGLLLVLGIVLLSALHRNQGREADENESAYESDKTTEAAETISGQPGTEDASAQPGTAEDTAGQPETAGTPAAGQEEPDANELPIMTDKDSSENKSDDGAGQQTSGQQTSAGNSDKPADNGSDHVQNQENDKPAESGNVVQSQEEDQPAEGGSDTIPGQEADEPAENAAEETMEKDPDELPIIPVQ